MKYFLIVLLAFSLLLSCSDSTNSVGQGRVIVETFDAPGPENVEAILLNVIEVSLHSESAGWQVLAEPDTVINFLDLVNGVMVELGDDSLIAGNYSQLRLLLADSNKIVIEGDTLDLTTPSGQSSGVKLNIAFELEAFELVHLYVDFDASKAIIIASDKYNLHPSFKVFKETLSGRVGGTVSDNSGAGIEGAVIDAVSDTDTTATITNENGDYLLILPAGMYDLSASATGFTTDNSSHTAIEVTAGMLDMMEVDFTLE